MSILQDLDPQYAKIHQQPSSTWRPALWAATFLLAAGGGYWLVANTPARTPSEVPVPQVTVQEKKNADHSAPTAPPESAMTAGATITENPRPEAEERANATPSKSASMNATDSLADSEFRRQTIAAPTAPPNAPKHASGKAERHKAATPPTAKNERTQAPVAKRASERDVDIITAIVR